MFLVSWGCQQGLAMVIQAEGWLAVHCGILAGAFQGTEGEEKV